jgi:hypothetical protein
MEILRKDIMGKSKNSLVNLLLDFRAATSGMATAKDYNTINTGTPIVMENVTVEMNV